MGLFNSSIKLKDTRTPNAKWADKYLTDLLGAPTPKIPEEQIAEMSDAEKLAQELVGEYGTSTAEGLDTLRGMAGAPDDITQDPTISALLDVIGKKGDMAANRLSRSLMLRGGRGGAGADMLGRQVTDTQKEMLAAAAPYAESAKQRKMSAAQLLNTLGESSALNRLNALSTTGSLPRTLQQMRNSAAYQRLMTEIMFPYQQKANLAGQIKQGGQMAVVKSPSIMEQVAGLAATAAKFIPGNGGGGGNPMPSATVSQGNNTATPGNWYSGTIDQSNALAQFYGY
ncbi:MAG: hypothetical protein LLG01_00915 [Planctomycetaceae bacterium]|nr:hypothetical protein [Planctomycetaceae bacterium]